MAIARTPAAGRTHDPDAAAAALAHAPVLLWSARADGARDWLSPGWATRLGRPLDALLGEGWLANVDADDAARWRGIAAASADARQSYELDLRVRTADGAWRWMLEQAAPRLDEHGALAGYAGALVDIDARKHSEEHLAERAQALRLADRRHARFLGLLSHALRGPLAPIGNVASVLRTLEADRPTLARLREILERQVSRMGRLIDDFVDTTRAAQGRMSVVKELVDVAVLVRAAIEASGPALAEGGHVVDLHLPQEHLTVRGDARRLSQAIAQLLGNAAKFTRRPGRIELAVRATALGVRIVVRDPGEGIDPAFLPHVFELFAQEQPSPPTGSGGLGIGLTLARRIAQVHGGDIAAASAGHGRGATFTLELPLARAAAPTHAPPALDEPFRVLVVDPDPDAGQALRREMEMWGNEVRVVADESEALAIDTDYVPQLVLCDVDGAAEHELERYAPLRRRFGSARTLFAAVGDPGSADDEARALARGYDSFLVKPLQPDLLARLLRACAAAQA